MTKRAFKVALISILVFAISSLIIRPVIFIAPAVLCSLLLYRVWTLPKIKGWFLVLLSLVFYGWLVGPPWSKSRPLDKSVILPAYTFSQIGTKYIDKRMAPRIVYGKISFAEFKLYLWSLPVIALILLFFKFKPVPLTEHLTQDGYVVTDTGELKHRWLAEQHLGRSLSESEIVHHINGRRSDNALSNLCVMKSEKHELFHSWLKWTREKKGRYPLISAQKRVLENEYGGILLE